MLLVAVVCVASAAIWFLAPTTPSTQQEPQQKSGDLGLCSITESTTSIGNQASTLVLATSSSRQWAIIQQPTNATNTVTLSFSGFPAVSGRGYQLTPATTTSPVDELALGFATQFRTYAPVRAITNTGSTTIKVIDCK